MINNFNLDIEIKPAFTLNFAIIYKGSDGIVEIKTKEALLLKLKYFNQRYNELFITNELFIHDQYETAIFKSFIESIISSVININQNNISKYYELSCKYEYLDLQQRIEKFNQERPDLLEAADQLSNSVDQVNKEQHEVISHKEELIAKNLDTCLRNGFLKKLPIATLSRILNSPKRQIIDHHLLFDFVIDRIQNHHKYKAKGDDEENLAILTCSLDYTKMSEDEISSLLSLEENLSVFHPINPEERMKTFINEATKYHLKILELEKMLKQLLSKENENEERINNLEKQFMPKNDNKNIIRNFDYSDYYSDDQYDNINTNSEQQFIQEEDNDDNKERNTNYIFIIIFWHKLFF